MSSEQSRLSRNFLPLAALPSQIRRHLLRPRNHWKNCNCLDPGNQHLLSDYRITKWLIRTVFGKLSFFERFQKSEISRYLFSFWLLNIFISNYQAPFFFYKICFILIGHRDQITYDFPFRSIHLKLFFFNLKKKVEFEQLNTPNMQIPRHTSLVT